MTILDKIVATKREEIAAAQATISAEELRERVADARPVRDFYAALTVADRVASHKEAGVASHRIKLIAEVKKASPSKGVIREDFNPVEIAKIYEANGAACISCLTDEKYFQGRLEYLTAIRSAVNIPILRKDFILDSYQLLEARAAGADAVLLIAECLDDCHLRSLHNGAIELGMTPLVELYEPANLPRVLEAGARLIGINNRDLRTFEVDLSHTTRLRQEIPDDCLVVGESGIETHDDVIRLADAGVDAILVGESLMRNRDIGAAVRELLG